MPSYLRSTAAAWLVGLALSAPALLVPAPFAPVRSAHAEEGPAKHVVQEGQSLWKIAKRWNVSVRALELANDLPEGKPIQPGVTLRIPSRAEAKKLEERAAQAARKEDAPKKKPAADDGGKGPEKPAEKAADGPKPKGEAASKGETEQVVWWRRPPGPETQTQKEPDERGGINPCLTDDPGFGIYERWSRAPSMGQMILPARGGVTKSGRFDVVFHFHGHEPARKEFVKVMDGAVLVGITLGIGSGAYSSGFASPQAFKDLVASVEKGVAEARGIPSAKVRKVALSAWSAGYGAVEQILTQPLGKELVDTVFLLDALHSGYGPEGLDENQLEPFLAFAKKAKAGQKLMFVSHSSIIPPGYASTTETANWLIMKLGGKQPRAGKKGSAPMGLEQNSRWDAGGFHVRGFDGNDKMDHCAHLGLLKDVLRVHLKPRWQSPRGQGPKPPSTKSPSTKPESPKPGSKAAAAGRAPKPKTKS